MKLLKLLMIIGVLIIMACATAPKGHWELTWDAGTLNTKDYKALTASEQYQFGKELRDKFMELDGAQRCLIVKIYAMDEKEKTHFYGTCMEWEKEKGY